MLGSDCKIGYISVPDVSWKVLSDAIGWKGGESRLMSSGSCFGDESIVFMEISDSRERQSVVIFSEKKNRTIQLLN